MCGYGGVGHFLITKKKPTCSAKLIVPDNIELVGPKEVKLRLVRIW